MAIIGWPDDADEMEEGDACQHIYQSPLGGWYISEQIISDKGIRKVGEVEGSEGPFDTRSEAKEVAESRTEEYGPVSFRD